MKKIALFPGSFNPVHNGHLGVARYVATRGLADEVWLVVSPQNPLKMPAQLAPFEDRLRMVELALDQLGEGRLKACDIERHLPTPSYTIDTLRVLRDRWPEVQFSLLVGSDVAAELPAWRESQQLRQLAQLLVYARGGGEATLELQAAPRFEVDATWIRTQFARGPSGAALLCRAEVLPRVVFDYIVEKGLYASAAACYERALDFYRHDRFGPALGELDKALRLDPGHTSARELRELIASILDFRHKDLYNP